MSPESVQALVIIGISKLSKQAFLKSVQNYNQNRIVSPYIMMSDHIPSPEKLAKPGVDLKQLKLRTSFRSKKEISLSPFRKNALRIMRSIPKGKIASYAQVAELAGKPGAAREIAWLLHHLEKNEVPWQRIVGSSGNIMFPRRRKEFREQILLLRREGVWVSDEGKIISPMRLPVL